MKNVFLFLLFVSMTAFSQQFDKKWNEVVANEKLGKIKTANSLVSKIYSKAVKQHNDVEIIKCFFYRSKFRQVLEENAQNIILTDLNQQISTASGPTKALLNLIYYSSVRDYYNENRYLIQRRTNLVSDSDDFLTWTTTDFETKTQIAIEATLADEAVLKNTPLTAYEAIFDFFTIDKFKTEMFFDDKNLYVIFLFPEAFQYFDW